MLITASILVETNIWLLLGVLFPVLLGGRSRGVGGVRTGKKIFLQRVKYSLVPMIVRWKLWLRGYSQKQKSRGLLISSMRYGAFDPFWGPKMGRFWPPALYLVVAGGALPGPLGGRSRGWGDPGLVKRRQPDRNQTTIRPNVMISSTE